ncbi:MAG: TonB-dependent receptor [Burkholderiales bacterium]|nr:TonB-dependent receptor [Burkholderiales bacterium]
MKYCLVPAACAVCLPLLAGADEIPIVTPQTVVTATRFPEPAGDGALDASVITAEQIAASPATTLPDLLAREAGLYARDLYGNGGANATVDMRGFGATGGQNTLVLLDGRRINDIDLSGVEWGVIPLAAIERIEIIRGSGAVLYGGGAVGGVVNIITRSPAGAQRALDARLRTGSLDTRQTQVTGTLSGERAGLILGGSYFHSDGYRENNRNGTYAAYLDARWLAEGGSFSFKAGLDDQDLQLPGARLVDSAAGIDELDSDRRGTSTPLDYAARDAWRAAIEWEQRAGRADVNVGLGYRRKQQDSYFDFGGFPDYREVKLGVWSFTPRLRVPLLAERATLVAGADWYRWDYAADISNSEANIAQPINRVEAAQDNRAVYLQLSVRATDSTSITAGWRYERQKIEAQDRYDPAAPGALFGSAAPAGEQTEREQAWELALRQALTGSLAAVVRAGRAFRFATVDETYEFSQSFTRQFQFLEPQTSIGYDVGMEYRTGALLARAALFQLDVDDEIHLDAYSAGIGNTNLPPSRRRGLELQARWQAAPNLALSGAYTHTDARFREGELPAYGASVDIAGNHVPLVPRHLLNVQVAWQFARAWSATAAAQYVSSQYMENDEPNSGRKIPGYGSANLRVDYRAGPWRIIGVVDNLFDEEYFNYAVRSQFTPTRYNAYPLPGRTWWVGVEHRFR